jgi:SAM-dependent methyltransferase
MDAKLYPSFQSKWDDELFRNVILENLRPTHHLLDIGAGAGRVSQMDFRGHAARICGVDPDERVVANPHLDEGRVGYGERLPYPDDTFDIVIADNVVEHFVDPVAVFGEVRRVLKPAGVFLFKTPNKWHYVAGMSRMTPHWFHQSYNRFRGRAAEDTFPTQYRANSRADIARTAAKAGLTVERIAFVEGRPEYLRPFALAYLAGWAYEKLVNSLPALGPIRVVLIATLRKPST